MNNDVPKRLVDSVSLTLIARVAMIAAAAALPVAGWMLSRGISTVDRVEGGVQKLETASSILHSKFDALISTVQDHETRIRVLEKPPIVVQPVPTMPSSPVQPPRR